MSPPPPHGVCVAAIIPSDSGTPAVLLSKGINELSYADVRDVQDSLLSYGYEDCASYEEPIGVSYLERFLSATAPDPNWVPSSVRSHLTQEPRGEWGACHNARRGQQPSLGSSAAATQFGISSVAPEAEGTASSRHSLAGDCALFLDPHPSPLLPSVPPCESGCLTDFTVLRVLGGSPQRRVLHAFDRRAGRMVELHRLSKCMTRERARRLQEEVDLHQYFDTRHENILRLYAYFADSEHVYMVFESTECRLSETLAHQPRIPTDQARKILRELLSAVRLLHESGVVHGLLRPASVGLREDHVKLMDLSAAVRIGGPRLAAPADEGDGGVWVAPELSGSTQPSTMPSDIWSIGVLGYALLCGALPRLHSAPMGDAVYYPSDLSPEACSFLSASLSLDPNRRHSAAKALQHPFLWREVRQQAPLQSDPFPYSPFYVGASVTTLRPPLESSDVFLGLEARSPQLPSGALLASAPPTECFFDSRLHQQMHGSGGDSAALQHSSTHLYNSGQRSVSSDVSVSTVTIPRKDTAPSVCGETSVTSVDVSALSLSTGGGSEAESSHLSHSPVPVPVDLPHFVPSGQRSKAVQGAKSPRQHASDRAETSQNPHGISRSTHRSASSRAAREADGARVHGEDTLDELTGAGNWITVVPQLGTMWYSPRRGATPSDCTTDPSDCAQRLSFHNSTSMSMSISDVSSSTCKDSV